MKPIRSKQQQIDLHRAKQLPGAFEPAVQRVFEDICDAMSEAVNHPPRFKLAREERERLRAAKSPPRDLSAPYDKTDPRPDWYKNLRPPE